MLLLGESAVIYSTVERKYHVPLLAILGIGTLVSGKSQRMSRPEWWWARERGFWKVFGRYERAGAWVAAIGIGAAGHHPDRGERARVVRVDTRVAGAKEVALLDARSGDELTPGVVSWREGVKAAYVFWSSELVKERGCVAIAVSGLPTLLAGSYGVGVLDVDSSRWVSQTMPVGNDALINVAGLRDGERFRVVISGANQEEGRLVVRPGRLQVEQRLQEAAERLPSLVPGLACLAISAAMFLAGWRGDRTAGRERAEDGRDGIADARGGQG